MHPIGLLNDGAPFANMNPLILPNFVFFTIHQTCAVCSNSFVDKFNSLESHWVEQSPQATNCVIQSGYLTSRSPPPDGECVLKYDGEYDALGFEIGVTALSSAVEYSMFIGVPAEETDVVSSDVAVQFWLSADAGELVLSIGSSPEEIFNLPYSGSQLKTTYTMTAAFTPEGNITFSLTDFGNALKDWSVDAGAYPGDAEQLGTKMAVLIQPPESTATGDLDNFRLVCPPGEGGKLLNKYTC